MSDKLKPCPFCGEEVHYIALYTYGEIEWTVRCTKCHFGMPAEDFKEARDKWNQRAEKGDE